MFSGETTIHAIMDNPAQTGIAMLLFMAVLKVFLLALSFKSGYLGGPIFPTVFSCAMIGLALSLVFPGIPAGIFVLCILGAVVTLALGAPLTAILLAVVMSASDQNMTILIIISSVVALVIGIEVRQLRENQAAGLAKKS
jgi:H+/Cl- antiporter ClcA